jgi:hypothetical protein
MTAETPQPHPAGPVEDPPPEKPRKRHLAPSWQVGLDLEIARLDTSLRRARAAEAGTRDSYATIRMISDQLSQARMTLQDFRSRNWLARALKAGVAYEQVLACTQSASESLLLVEDEAAAEARIPGIRAAVKAYLGPDDPRVDTYTRFMDQLADGVGHRVGRYLVRRPAADPTPAEAESAQVELPIVRGDDDF